MGHERTIVEVETLLCFFPNLASPFAAMSSSNTAALINAFLDTTVNEIIPLTAKGVASGAKVFGAAIYQKDNLKKAVQVASNNETVSPLLVRERSNARGCGARGELIADLLETRFDSTERSTASR